MIDVYLIVKFLHVLSATILVGTGIGIAFFCWFGSRYAIAQGDIGTLRTVLRFTVQADTIFTAPAVVVQFLTGGALIELAHWSWLSPWALTVIGLFVLIGACWLPVVRIQIQLRDMAIRATSVPGLPASFYEKFRFWFMLGIPAFVSIVVIVYLMVVKPFQVI